MKMSRVWGRGKEQGTGREGLLGAITSPSPTEQPGRLVDTIYKEVQNPRMSETRK